MEVSLGMVGGHKDILGGDGGEGGGGESEGEDEGGGGGGEDWQRGLDVRPRRIRSSGLSRVGRSGLFSDAEAERVR